MAHGECVCCEELPETEQETERLRARVRTLEGALREVEWAQRTTRLRNGGTIYTAETCPSCGGEKDPPRDANPHRQKPPFAPEEKGGHKPDCRLRRALSGDAGGEEAKP